MNRNGITFGYFDFSFNAYPIKGGVTIHYNEEDGEKLLASLYGVDITVENDDEFDLEENKIFNYLASLGLNIENSDAGESVYRKIKTLEPNLIGYSEK